eukprot:g12729.t1
MAWTPRVARVFAHGGRRWPLLVRSEGIFPLSRISVTRPLSSEVAPGGSPSAAAEETKARSVDVHKARPVTPLRFDEEKLIFVSDVDVKEVVMAARRSLTDQQEGWLRRIGHWPLVYLVWTIGSQK